MSNSGSSIYTDIVELNHTKLEVTYIVKSTHGIILMLLSMLMIVNNNIWEMKPLLPIIWILYMDT